MPEPGTRREIDMDRLERALDAIRYAATLDYRRGATARGRALDDAADLMESMAVEINRLSS